MTRRYRRVKVRRRRSATAAAGKTDGANALPQLGTPYAPAVVDSDEGPVNDQVRAEDQGIVKTLLKQVRPGMDLSKVVLPTFILEPRSFLEKLTDYFAHNDLLARVAKGATPEERMVRLVNWYLSGFYLGPKGVKKPYNPIIGETFRCRWTLPPTAELPFASRTHFYAEQVSHHPPISAFYCSNRRAGFTVNGSIRFKSKFQLTHVMAILYGVGTLTLNELGEEYIIGFPKAKASGWFSTLKSEIVSEVELTCPTTGYSALIEFKPKPVFGGTYNSLTGVIRKTGETNTRGKVESEVLYNFAGVWNQRIEITDARTGVTSELWDVRGKREKLIPLEKPPIELQDEFESNRLWAKVTRAIVDQDQVAATEEKYVLEKRQRDEQKEREATGTEWQFKHFRQDDPDTEFPRFTYVHINTTPFEPTREAFEYEEGNVIKSAPVGGSAAGEGSAAGVRTADVHVGPGSDDWSEEQDYTDVYTNESYEADDAEVDAYTLKREEFLAITSQLRTARETITSLASDLTATQSKLAALEEGGAQAEKAARQHKRDLNAIKSSVKSLEDRTQPEGWTSLSFLLRLALLVWIVFSIGLPNLRFWQYFTSGATPQ